METSLAANLGRAQIIRKFASWLEAHPDLPIGYVSIAVDGQISVRPTEIPGPVYTYRARKIAGLYAIADAVGTEVTLTPNRYRGWDLTASWRVGAATVTATLDIDEAATAVHPIPDAHADQPPAALSPAA